jgi:hypothetical protein
MHSNLARCIAAENGPVLTEDHARSVSSCGEGAWNASGTASGYEDIAAKGLGF